MGSQDRERADEHVQPNHTGTLSFNFLRESGAKVESARIIEFQTPLLAQGLEFFVGGDFLNFVFHDHGIPEQKSRHDEVRYRIIQHQPSD